MSNSGSNNNNQSKSINRNSSKEDSFYSLNSLNEEILIQSDSDRD